MCLKRGDFHGDRTIIAPDCQPGFSSGGKPLPAHPYRKEAGRALGLHKRAEQKHLQNAIETKRIKM